MALCGKYHFRGPVHSQQRAAQVHQTPGIATSSVRFLTAEDCFPGEPQAAAQQGFLSGATHHIPSTSHPSHLSHSSSPLHCAGSPVCGTAWEIRSGEWTGLEITWEGGDCFSNLVAWSAVHLEQSRLEVRGRGGEGMVWKPCQHRPQGDGPSVLSCGCGILQTICLRVDFWCAVSFSLGGMLRLMLIAKESASVRRNTLFAVADETGEPEVPFLLLALAGFLCSHQPVILSPPPCFSAGLLSVSSLQQG